MSENAFRVLSDISMARNAPFGAFFLTILTTVNFIAAASKVKLQMAARMNQWLMNTNTFSVFIGPPTCGKTNTIKAAIMDPFKEIGRNLKESIKGRMTMAALADSLADKDSGHKVYMVNSEVAETLSR